MARFSNYQWKVTKDELESVEPAAPYLYDIEADRLLETTERSDGVFYDWPVHLADKEWLDLHAFADAYRAAIAHHARKLPHPVDEEMLERSIERGLKECDRRS